MDIIKSLLILSIPLLTLRFLVKRFHRRLPFPPGPQGVPILGNFFDLRAEKHDVPIWVTYLKWSQTYGDISSFHVFGTRTVILNSYKAIVDLLERRSYNYSDRLRWPMAGELMRYKWMLPIMGYSNQWRMHRRIFHQLFRPRVVPEYYDIQRERAVLLVQRLAATPNELFKHAREHSGGTILEVIYGYHTQEDNDPFIKLADGAVEGPKEAGIFGSFWVDYFPALKHIPAWFPGGGFKVKAESWARDAERLRDNPWANLKQRMVDGTAVPCFSTRSLERFGILSHNSEDHSVAMEEVIKNSAGISFLAGADTTVSAILSFVLAMVLNPEVQARAQKELEEVIGLSRLPDFDDRESLPYINAVFWETLRWNPVLPLAIPHGVVNDDVYEGYLIPAGSTVVPNTWAVMHDESVYGPDVTSFNPDRFMKQDGKDLPLNPELLAFGYGRRICPGRYFAINTVWITITYLLTGFTMAEEVDDEGKEVDLVAGFAFGGVSHPLPFNCRFIPRPSMVLL